MPTGAPGNVTRLIRQIDGGAGTALQKLMPILYRDLRQVAGRAMRDERGNHTLSTTGLVHETYLRLLEQRKIEWKDRKHFLMIAAQLMRRILVDHARRHAARKRSRPRVSAVIARHQVAGTACDAVDLIALDDAMKQLATWDEQACRVVELRYFAGLTVAETAETLGISPTTVKRDWAVSKSWLRRQFGHEALTANQDPN